jgi:hypothetical protein
LKPSWLRRHGGDLLAVAALAAFTLVIFWKALADPAGMIGGDAAYLYQDYYTMAAHEVQAGRIPLWNPYILMGVPFHASLQPALFYPLRWPMFWMDYVPGYVFTLCLHYFLGAVAAYLLVRVAMRVKPLPAVVGAMSIVFGGFALGHASHPNYFLSYPWFFGSILCLWLAMDRRQWRWVPPAGACLGLMMLVGSVHLLLILSVLLGTLAVYFALVALGDDLWVRWGKRKAPPDRPTGWREIFRPISTTTAALVLGVLIGMIQLWPAYGLYKNSSRGGADESSPAAAQMKYSRITFGSANPQRTALQMVAPFYYGDMRLGYWGEVSHDEMTHYTGLVTLVLAAVGIAGIGLDRRRWAFVAVGLAGLVFGTGKFFPHFYDALYALLPPFRALRFPTRIWWCTDIALSCLGAYGLQRILQKVPAGKASGASDDSAGRAERRTRVVAAIVAAVIVVVLAGAMVQLREYAHSRLAAEEAVRGNGEIHEDFWFPSRVQAAQDAPRRIFEGDAAIWMGVVAAGLGAVLIAGLAWRRKTAGRLAQAAVVALLAADLLAMSFGMVMYNDQFSLMHRPPDWANWIGSHVGNQRTLREVVSRAETSRERSDVNRGMLLGFRQADGLGGGIVDSMARSTFIQFASQPVQYRGPDGRPAQAWDLMNALRSIAGVKYLLVEAGGKLPEDRYLIAPAWSDANWQVFECRAALPPAFFVEGAVQVKPGSGIDYMFNPSQPFDPAKRAIVYGAPPAETASAGPARREAKIAQAIPGRWEIETTADAPGQLVISEGYDPGWRCEIDGDGKPVTVYQTDDQVISVPVPAGAKHSVVLSYDPPEFRRGAWVTIVGIVLLLASAAAGFVASRRRRAGSAQEPLSLRERAG